MEKGYMPPTTPAKDDPSAQLRRFQDAARELEGDDDAERFDERVRRMARAPTANVAEPES